MIKRNQTVPVTTGSLASLQAIKVSKPIPCWPEDSQLENEYA